MKIIIELDTNNKDDKDLLDRIVTIGDKNSVVVSPDSSEDIDNLELPTRVSNAFKSAKVNTINQLRECLLTNPERSLRGIGKWALMCTKEQLEKYDKGKRGQELWS